MTAQLYALAGALALFLAACEDEDGTGGNDDTLLTGLSGLVILIIVIWLIARAVRKRRP